MTTVVVAQSVGAAVCLLALPRGVPSWAAVVAAAVVGGALFTRVGGRFAVAGSGTVLGLIGTRRPTIGRTTPTSTPRARQSACTGSPARSSLSSKLLPPSGHWTRVTRERVDSPDHLPVAALASCLNQHDVTLGGIDIVAPGVAPSPALRPPRCTTTWSVRFPPSPAAPCGWRSGSTPPPTAASVARRGGGEEGAARTVAVAARRVVRALGDAGYASRILPATDVESAAALICRGVHPDAMDSSGPMSRSRACATPATRSNPGISAANCSPRCGRTPASGRPSRCACVPPQTRIRYSSVPRPDTPVRCRPEVCGTPGLISMQGRHRDALVAQFGRLVPGSRPPHSLLANDPAHSTACTCRCRLRATRRFGRPGPRRRHRLSGPGVRDVLVDGELYLAQQGCSGLWGPVRGCWSTPTDLMRGRHW